MGVTSNTRYPQGGQRGLVAKVPPLPQSRTRRTRLDGVRGCGKRERKSKAGVTPCSGLSESSLRSQCYTAVRKMQQSGAIGKAKPLHYNPRIFGLVIMLPANDRQLPHGNCSRLFCRETSVK